MNLTFYRASRAIPPKGLYSTLPSMSGIVNQSMPMAAIFLRNRFVAWFAVIQSVHYYLNTDEDEANAKDGKQSSSIEQTPIIKVAMAMVGLIVCYMNLVFPVVNQMPQPPSDEIPITEEK